MKKNKIFALILVPLTIAVLTPAIGRSLIFSTADSVIDYGIHEFSATEGYKDDNGAKSSDYAHFASKYGVYGFIDSELPVTGWEPSSDDNFVAYDSCLLFDGHTSQTTLTVIKRFAINSYFLDFYHESNAPIDGLIAYCGGEFSNGKGDTIKLTKKKFVYNATYEAWEDQTFASNDSFDVHPYDFLSSVNLTLNGQNASVTYPEEYVDNGKFVLKDQKSSASITGIASVYENGATIEKLIHINISLFDFIMDRGAAALNNGSIGMLKYSLTLPSSMDQNAKYGFLCVDINDLGENEFTPETVFYQNNLFTFNKADTTKIYVKHESVVPSFSGSNYFLTGYSDHISSDLFAHGYLGLFYTHIGNQYFFASENNSRRSLYQIAYLSNNASLMNKYINCYTGSSTLNYTIKTHKIKNGLDTVTTQNLIGNIGNDIIPSEYSDYQCTSPSTYLCQEGQIIEHYYKYQPDDIIDLIAWGHPIFDPENNFDNATNDAIVQTMVDAGFNTVILDDGNYDVMYSQESAKFYEYVITEFNKFGIKTIIFANDIFALRSMPDFSLIDGFYGYMSGDEPNKDEIDKLASVASKFDATYGSNSDYLFIENLFPSSASSEARGGITNQQDYVQYYNDQVLSKVSSNKSKVFSIDNYPYGSNGKLAKDDSYFFTDLATVSGFAKEYNAKSSITLQSCTWNADEGSKGLPSSSEMSSQAYLALTFGIHSIGWWVYGGRPSLSQDNITNFAPVDNHNVKNESIYNSLASINSKVSYMASLLKGYTYKGIYSYSSSSNFYKLPANCSYFTKHFTRTTSTSSLNFSFPYSWYNSSDYAYGLYENGASKAVIMTNMSSSTLSTYVKSNGTATTIYRQDGTSASLSTSNTYITLAPGEAIIFKS